MEELGIYPSFGVRYGSVSLADCTKTTIAAQEVNANRQLLYKANAQLYGRAVATTNCVPTVPISEATFCQLQ
jgi:hypothetical protein